MGGAFTICITVTLALASINTALAETYDLVIRNGRVMDPETKLDGVRNLGVKDGRIAVVTEKEIDGTEVIDARNLVVAPGFIDHHMHGQDPFSVKISLRDGVTTGLDLEAGASTAFAGSSSLRRFSLV